VSLRDTESQSELKIRGNSGMLSRRQNIHFLISKFKKLQQKSTVLGNSQIGQKA